MLRELDLAEPKIVEHVLELVRKRAHPGRAEEPRQPLQRVNGAKDVVDELRIGGALATTVVERGADRATAPR